ncbi:MAG: hypothetical protein A2Y33_05215 [Spirochaetes bacterium GWF1_51_8]|nr:MAG: hypothetical protein A2Y33_05215 [Spirochaetes bacterium GWF1_51_8]
MPYDENEITPLYQLYASIGKLITSSLDLNDILDGVMKEVRFFFNPENWSLFRLDPASGQLFFVIAEGVEFDKVKNIQLRMNEGIAGTVAATSHYIYVPDTSADSRFSNKVDQVTGYVTRSIIAVPLTCRGQVYGVLELINPREQGKVFTKADLMILQTIADFAAIAFANATTYRLSSDLAEKDPLTGLHNRTKLKKIAQYCKDAQSPHRRGRDCAIITIIVFVDLDHFKEVNDTYGHRTGDRVLQDLAQHLREVLRHQDYVFRIGGDEFIILIDVDNPELRDQVIGRFNNRLPVISSEFGKTHWGVTFSYGIAWGYSGDIEEIIHRADEDMYKQKSGK